MVEIGGILAQLLGGVMKPLQPSGDGDSGSLSNLKAIDISNRSLRLPSLGYRKRRSRLARRLAQQICSYIASSRRPTMKSVIVAVLSTIVFAAAAQAMPNGVVTDLARTGSTITVHGFADYR
jgi:hypothetical protein